MYAVTAISGDRHECIATDGSLNHAGAAKVWRLQLPVNAVTCGWLLRQVTLILRRI
jgi:hypothetical protein